MQMLPSLIWHAHTRAQGHQPMQMLLQPIRGEHKI